MMLTPAPAIRNTARIHLCHALWLLMLAIYLLQGWMLQQSGERYWPGQIMLTLEPGQSRVLGQRELAAAQADRQHLRLLRHESGNWQIHNISHNKHLLLQKGSQETRLGNAAVGHDLSEVQRLIVGRTHFGLQIHGSQLRLTPTHRIMLFTQRDQVMPDGVAWEWHSTANRTIAADLSALLLLASALLLLLARGRRHWLGLASLLLASCGLWAVLIPPTLAQALSLSLLSALLLLSLQPRPGTATALALCLVACGLLVQLELALGGMESVWPKYYQKSGALQALGIGMCALLHLARPLRPRLAQVDACLFALAALALTLMLCEALLGSEAGVFGIQPVELAKTALVALTAHVLALLYARKQQAQSAPVAHGMAWHLLWPVLVLLAMVSLALVRVSDFSPLLLLLAWALSSSLAWFLLRQQYWPGSAVLGLMLCPLLVIMALHQSWLELPQQFYAGRFLVWLEPHLHPHTGQQFLLGAQAIAAGGWMGADQQFGLASIGTPLGELGQIPALQDDFAPAFFLNRHGLLAALLLWLLQASFLCALLAAAWRSWHWADKVGDFRLAWHGRFYAMALIGAVGFLLAQFVLAWSTNLGMLPVMGQPMSFLSSGGSHLLFFLLPLLGFNALYAPPFEE